MILFLVVAGRTIEARLVHWLKAYSPTYDSSNPSGSSTAVSDEQPENAYLPMMRRLVGSVTEASPVQSSKALSPMSVTPSGMTIAVKEGQRAKVMFSNAVRFFDRVTEDSWVQP